MWKVQSFLQIFRDWKHFFIKNTKPIRFLWTEKSFCMKARNNFYFTELKLLSYLNMKLLNFNNKTICFRVQSNLMKKIDLDHKPSTMNSKSKNKTNRQIIVHRILFLIRQVFRTSRKDRMNTLISIISFLASHMVNSNTGSVDSRISISMKLVYLLWPLPPSLFYASFEKDVFWNCCYSFLFVLKKQHSFVSYITVGRHYWWKGFYVFRQLW